MSVVNILLLGLHGELIPMAIPVKLPQHRSVYREQQLQEPSPPQNEMPSPPQASALTTEHESPPQMQPPPASLVSTGDCCGCAVIVMNFFTVPSTVPG